GRYARLLNGRLPPAPDQIWRAERGRLSMSSKPLVIVTRKLPDAIETRMMELFNVRLNNEDAPMTQAALVEAVKTADVLVPTVTDRIDSAVLSQAGERL